MTPGDIFWLWMMNDVSRGRPLAALLVAIVSASGWTALGMILVALRKAIVPPREAQPELINPSRRRFLFDTALASAGCLSAGAAANAALREPWRLQLQRYEVSIADLPPELDGLRIAQISDTHLGPRIPASFVREAIDLAISLKPDLFFLTGDYVSAKEHFIQPAAAMFRAVVDASPAERPPVGVLGNHDWQVNGAAMREALAAVGVRMIDNAHVFLDAATRAIVNTPPARGVAIVGVGDLSEDRIDAYHAFLNVPPKMPRLLLSHQPDVAEMVDVTGIRRDGRRSLAPRVDVMFSGHTHGGQVKLPIIGAPLVPSLYGQKYIGGVVQGPAFPVVMSRGVGMSVLPIRWGAPPEIVEITLRAKSARA